MTDTETGVLDVALLGSPALSFDGRPLRFNVRPRVVPLLAYLLLHPARPAPRDQVAFALWPDETEDAARTNLRRHLHYLREALPVRPEPWVIAGTDDVQWNPAAPVRVDVGEFERLVERRESRARAAALYAGDLLPAVDDEWLLVPRERLRARYQNALWELACDARARRDRERATEYLQRLLASDPWREDAVREMMAVRYESGDRAGALALHAEFEERLKGELGVEAMPETAALKAAIASGAPLPRLPAPHNLPASASRFVGRVDELAQIERLLDESRVVTIGGPGGIGKTRAALLVAEQRLDSYDDGVWFVDLALIDDPALVVEAIESALGVRGSRAGDLETLVRYVARRSLLLIVDNCEHLVDEVARVVGALIRGAPRLRVLATSRQGLGIAGEAVYGLPPLGVQDAVALFVARAQAVAGGFDASTDRAGVVADICRRLDGIPLAIELAAARVTALSVAELSAALDERFRVLVGGDRTALARQRTMRALIDWSYDLLPQQERLLFDRLSVFVGGFSLESAAAVCAGNGIDAADVLTLLASLVDKSLVTADRSQTTTRFRLLESSREYGREKLRERGEEAALARRHAEAYFALAQRLDRTFSSELEPDWMAAVEGERGNWIAALAWALESKNDVALGQRLMLGRPIWMNWNGQPRRWLRLALDSVTEATDPGLAAALLIKEAAVLTELGDYEQGARSGEAGVRIYRAMGDAKRLAGALYVTGAGLVFCGRIADGAAAIEEAIELLRATGDKANLAYALLALGQARAAAGDLEAERALVREARASFDPEALTVECRRRPVAVGGGSVGGREHLRARRC